MRIDPRFFQIAVLSGVLAYGVLRLDFDAGAGHIGLLISTAILTQFGCTRLWRLSRFDPRSALISGLSLSLLLRTGSPILAVVTAALTVASKFLIRVDGRHVFNPTNLGLVMMMLVSDEVWVSPGQWGQLVFFGFLLACLGIVVVNRAARSDVTYAFLAFYVAIVFLRTAWLGDPFSIPLHQLQSGGLVLFAFFMISDPKTTPDSRTGRIIFALLVALGAAFVQFALHHPNGPLWSLATCAMTVPLINRWFPGDRYAWTTPHPAPHSTTTSATPTVAQRRPAFS